MAADGPTLHEALLELGITSEPGGFQRRRLVDAHGAAIGEMTAHDAWSFVHKMRGDVDDGGADVG